MNNKIKTMKNHKSPLGLELVAERQITNHKSKGFSLVELLVVVTIIAILSVTAYMALGGQTAKARNAKRVQDLSTIQSALEIYFINNNNTYPTVLDDGNTAIPETDLVPQYMPKIPVDPSNAAKSPLYYVNTTNYKTYLLSTIQESEGTANPTAYLIGNSTDTITGLSASGCASCPSITNGGSCLPYCL